MILLNVRIDLERMRHNIHREGRRVVDTADCEVLLKDLGFERQYDEWCCPATHLEALDWSEILSVRKSPCGACHSRCHLYYDDLAKNGPDQAAQQSKRPSWTLAVVSGLCR